MKNIRTLFLVLVALLLAACKTVEVANPHPNVVVYGKDVRIDRVSEHVLDGGVLQTVVLAHSTSRYERAARYRAIWSDIEGRPIKTTVSVWSEITLAAERPFNMEFVGPGERARRYRVEIEVLGDD